MQAQSLCEARGGRLPTPRTPADNAALHAATPNAAFFLGLTDAAAEGVWMWDAHAGFVGAPWTNWLRKGEGRGSGAEPNGGKRENCAVMVKVNVAGISLLS